MCMRVCMYVSLTSDLDVTELVEQDVAGLQIEVYNSLLPPYCGPRTSCYTAFIRCFSHTAAGGRRSDVCWRGDVFDVYGGWVVEVP